MQMCCCGRPIRTEKGYRMDYETWKAAIEAQFLMGYWPPSPHMAMDRKAIVNWSWGVDQVRKHLHVPLNDLWEQRVLELEAQGLASFTLYSAAATRERPGWRDEPREKWGTVDISARGVLKLATLYGRPYVRLEESPALLAHWQLVQGASEARLHTPHDPVQWEREWPEQAILWKAREAECWRRHEEE